MFSYITKQFILTAKLNNHNEKNLLLKIKCQTVDYLLCVVCQAIIVNSCKKENAAPNNAVTRAMA